MAIDSHPPPTIPSDGGEITPPKKPAEEPKAKRASSPTPQALAPVVQRRLSQADKSQAPALAPHISDAPAEARAVAAVADKSLLSPSEIGLVKEVFADIVKAERARTGGSLPHDTAPIIEKAMKQLSERGLPAKAMDITRLFLSDLLHSAKSGRSHLNFKFEIPADFEARFQTRLMLAEYVEEIQKPTPDREKLAVLKGVLEKDKKAALEFLLMVPDSVIRRCQESKQLENLKPTSDPASRQDYTFQGYDAADMGRLLHIFNKRGGSPAGWLLYKTPLGKEFICYHTKMGIQHYEGSKGHVDIATKKIEMFLPSAIGLINILMSSGSDEKKS